MKKRGAVFAALCLVLILAFSAPEKVCAAAKPVTITTCKLADSAQVVLKASLPKPKEVYGSRCYLFKIRFGRSTIASDQKPMASVKKASQMTFRFKLTEGSSAMRLYYSYVLASKGANGKYTVISNQMYISNPKKLASYTYKFPSAVSKKGLQTSDAMREDAVDLNVRNSAINISFTQLIAPASQQNTTASYRYRYMGQTYWFLKDTVNYYDRQLQALQQTDSVNSAILLLGWRDDLTSLIYPDGRERGHSFYAWNTISGSARRQLQAAMYFLAKRYSPKGGQYGRIVNWIIGNEVNNYKTYNYAGSKTLGQYAQIYADAFRMAYTTITSVYSNARIYISLDHLWNTHSVDGTFASRSMLDKFAGKLQNGGNIPWNLAYHAYSSPLTEPRFWANTNGQVTQSLTSPVINMGNIGLLTSYIKWKYGSGTRIILSEQGYTSSQNGRNTQALQAAAIAYTYLLAEADDMIDSVIIHRQVDHRDEIAQGLSLGLWTTSGTSSSPEDADNRKDAWGVFKYMDTNLSPYVTASALPQIGAKTWQDLIPSYNKQLYTKVTHTLAYLKTVKSYKKTAAISPSWKLYGAANRIYRTQNVFTVCHEPGRNRNSQWGFTQSFPNKLSFGSSTSFYTSLIVNDQAASQAQICIRFYSGKQIFEAAGTIPTNRSIKTGVSLANWKYRKSVDKIQVLVQPIGKSGWTDSAAFHMLLPVRGR